MRNVAAIFSRELRVYFGLPWAYIVAAVFLVVSGFGFGWTPEAYADTSIRGFLGWGSFFLLFLAPALTMRLFAREFESGTIELLLTAPVRDFEVVLGKYLASLAMLAGMLALTLYYPLLLAWFGSPDWGPIATGYLGIFLLGSVFLAAGLFASSLTANQVVAFVLGSGIVLFLWFLGQAAGFVEGSARDVIRYASLSGHYPDFGRGILDTRGVIYYASLSALLLFFTLRSVEMRRWR